MNLLVLRSSIFVALQCLGLIIPESTSDTKNDLNVKSQKYLTLR